MTDDEGAHGRRVEPFVQLAVRIPKTLHRTLKIHCVTADVPLTRFVIDAIADKLGREIRPPVTRPRSKGPA